MNFGYSEEKQILKDISLTTKRGSNVHLSVILVEVSLTVMKILFGFYLSTGRAIPYLWGTLILENGI